MAVATRQWKYDVFLNFRGRDIRWTFLSHLRGALRRANLVTFYDEDLMRGEEISPALLKAIEESNVAVPIFSLDYASSPWCLDELVKIIECYKKCKGQIVIPVFYDVSSSVVLDQNGIYGDAFAKHKRDPEKARYVAQWKAAMTKAANLPGRSAQNARSESELVKEIVNDILIRLGRTSDGTNCTVETGSLSVKVAHTRTVEIQVPGGPRVTKYEDLPVDQLVSLFEPLQRLSEASLQSLENSNTDSSPRRASAPGLLGFVEQSKNSGQKSGTVLNNKAKIVQASASAPKLSDYTEGSKNAGSGSSSTHVSSLPTSSELFKGEDIKGVEEIKQLKETGQLAKLIEGVSVVRDGRIDSINEQAPKGRSWRRVEHNEESKNVTPVGSSEVACASGPQAPNPRSWRRLARALARNFTPVGSSAVSFYVRTKQSLSFFFFFFFFLFYDCCPIT